MDHRGVTARLLAAGTALLACVLCSVDAGAQCAMCSTAVGSSAGVARGFAVSIVFLLSTLSAVVGGFVALVVSRTRETPAVRRAAERGMLQTAGPGAPAARPNTRTDSSPSSS